MSSHWPNRRFARALYRPPRRALLTAGTIAVPASMLAGGDPTMAGFIGLSALAAFFMGHVEREMHPAGPRHNSGRQREHSTDENGGYPPHETTATTKE